MFSTDAAGCLIWSFDVCSGLMVYICAIYFKKTK